MEGYWRWRTPRGQVSIVPDGRGRFDLMFDYEKIGSYHRPEFAHDDAIHGSHFSTSSGVRTSDLDLPTDLSDWEFVRWS